MTTLPVVVARLNLIARAVERLLKRTRRDVIVRHRIIGRSRETSQRQGNQKETRNIIPIVKTATVVNQKYFLNKFDFLLGSMMVKTATVID